MKYFVTSIIVIVALVIGVGLFVIGSPAKERMRRMDESRVQSLQMIQNQVVEYWRAKGKTPVALTDMHDSLGGQNIPVDPETQTSYEYEKVSDTSFRLCAQFATALDIPDQNGRMMTYPAYPGLKGGSDTWTHAAGRVCFERTIDPDYFQPVPALKD